jgi:putative hydrolase
VSDGPPFGFGTSPGDSPDDPDRPSGADNPLASLFGAMGGDANDLGSVLHRLGDLFSWRGGPVNWDLAKDVAQQAIDAVPDGDPAVSEADAAAVTDAVRIGEVWLDSATALPAGAIATEAWTRKQWLDATQPMWAELTEPVATKVVAAMGQAVPGEMAAMAGPLLGMFGQVGGVLFGAQLGQALGSLSLEVVGSTDIGLPLGPRGHAGLVPAGVRAFGEGLGVPDDEVRIFLALREAAHHRLFQHVPWLRAHLLDAVAAYARGIHVDTEALEAAVRDLDPNDPEALQRALAGGPDGGLLSAQPSPEQASALARLETALALVEGWVDEVVAAAAEGHLPAAGALRETVRRRRAVGGPAEQTFATLVGLELRPRRSREAAALWAALRDARGVDGRDALWAHPDLMPSTDDLDDPGAFVTREEPDLPGLGDL